jgi:tryptophan synthase alpha chain
MVNLLGRGFIYYVTVTGVTGARQQLSDTLVQDLSRVVEQLTLPVVAGFGISTPDQAADVAKHTDGVVVGSALVKLFEKFSGTLLEQELRQFVRTLKSAIS